MCVSTFLLTISPLFIDHVNWGEEMLENECCNRRISISSCFALKPIDKDSMSHFVLNILVLKQPCVHCSPLKWNYNFLYGEK